MLVHIIGKAVLIERSDNVQTRITAGFSERSNAGEEFDSSQLNQVELAAIPELDNIASDL